METFQTNNPGEAVAAAVRRNDGAESRRAAQRPAARTQVHAAGCRGFGQVRSNNAVNASARPVTPLACASGAPSRPARYRERCTDRNMRRVS